MLCHLCGNPIKIQTDPKNAEYVVMEGAKRKIEEWQPEDNETIKLLDSKDAEKMSKNAFFKLEHEVDDKKRAAEALPKLEQIQDSQNVWKNDYAASRILRKRYREESKEHQLKKNEADVIRQRASFNIPILPEAEEDKITASKVLFKNEKSGLKKNLNPFSFSFNPKHKPSHLVSTEYDE